MKTTLFVVSVLIAGYYLLSQTKGGTEWLQEHLPKTQIDQAAKDLLQQVDDKLQAHNTKANENHQSQITELENRIAKLESLIAQESSVYGGIGTIEKATEKSVEKSAWAESNEANKDVIAPDTDFAAPIKRVKTVTVGTEPTDSKHTSQQHKQSKLQDIAERMQLAAIRSLNH